MRPTRRTLRVANLLHAECSRVLREEIVDPRLQGVSITGAQLSPDLKVARVFYRTPEGVAEAEVQKGLGKARGFFRKRIGENVEMKFIPELRFERDDQMESSERVLSFLRQEASQHETV